LNEDIPWLLQDLPNLILAQKKYNEECSTVIRFRVSPSDKKRIEQNSLQKGYTSVSGYMRDIAMGR